jgi:chaperonin GroES
MTTGIKYEPLYDRLLIRVLDPGATTKSGLFIPSMAIDNTPWMRGEVVAVGHGRLMADGSTVAPRVKVGDVVIFFRSQAGGEQLVFPTDDDGELLCIREPNVLAIVTGLAHDTGLVTPDGMRLVQ